MELPGDRTGALIGGRYRVERTLGQGGMGAVYEATHLGLGKRVAVKVLLPHFAGEPDIVERFRREALAAASLHHPNIVQVLDFGNDASGAPFMVMEMLEGASLGRLLKQHGTMPWPRLAPLIIQLLGALSAAHGAGIVHRDIKPDNVFVVPVHGVGELVRLLDFGVAKLTDPVAHGPLTAAGTMLGSPAFMAPEQMLGDPVDARTDVYAVGMLIYRALVGRVRFRGDGAVLLRAVLEGAGEPLELARPDLPPQLAAIVACAMERLPAMRFQSADAMRVAIEQVGAQAAAVARHTVAMVTGGVAIARAVPRAPRPRPRPAPAAPTRGTLRGPARGLLAAAMLGLAAVLGGLAVRALDRRAGGHGAARASAMPPPTVLRMGDADAGPAPVISALEPPPALDADAAAAATPAARSAAHELALRERARRTLNARPATVVDARPSGADAPAAAVTDVPAPTNRPPTTPTRLIPLGTLGDAEVDGVRTSVLALSSGGGYPSLGPIAGTARVAIGRLAACVARFPPSRRPTLVNVSPWIDASGRPIDAIVQAALLPSGFTPCAHAALAGLKFATPASCQVPPSPGEQRCTVLNFTLTIQP